MGSKDCFFEQESGMLLDEYLFFVVLLGYTITVHRYTYSQSFGFLNSASGLARAPYSDPFQLSCT